MPASPERRALAERLFLEDHPEVVTLLHAITPRHAAPLDMTVEQLQRSELDRAIAREAKLRRLSADAYLDQYLARADGFGS